MLYRSSTRRLLEVPSREKNLTYIFLMEASFIFSRAALIFSALARAAASSGSFFSLGLWASCCVGLGVWTEESAEEVPPLAESRLRAAPPPDRAPDSPLSRLDVSQKPDSASGEPERSTVTDCPFTGFNQRPYLVSMLSFHRDSSNLGVGARSGLAKL